MEVQSKLNPRYIWYGVIGLLSLILLGLLIALGMILLTPKKPGTATPAAAAATSQPASKPTQPAATAARTAVPETPVTTAAAPTSAPTTAATAPTAAATATPAKSPAPTGQTARPGVYVTQLIVNPAQPHNGEPPTFTAAFANTTGTPISYKWFIQIYSGQTNKRFGDTRWQEVYIPTGTNALPAIQGWSVKVKAGCEPYYAQAEYYDSAGARVPFTTTDGKIAAVSFNVCK